MFSKSKAPAALAVYFAPAIYTAGSVIEGEVELNFRQLREDNIDEVHVKLRGLSDTWIILDKVTLTEQMKLAFDDVSVWSRGGAYPDPGSDILRFPFRFTLPERLPPSFKHQSSWQIAQVKYSVCAVGARKGRLTPNRRHRVPIAVLPRDELGASVREEAVTQGWKRFDKEDSIRKGLWGDYAKVHVELALPDIPVLPLFSDIPYTITVTTTSAPLSREKANADKAIFPPVPHDPHEIEFDLHQKLLFRAQDYKGNASNSVATILGGKKEKRPQAAVDVSFPEKEWAPLNSALVADEKERSGQHHEGGGSGGKGSWVQRATFQSTFRLNCPPTFAVHNIECNYVLVVKVPFPGMGNSLKLEVPVNVTSGIDKPLARDPSAPDAETEPPILDLPPAYWDPESNDWDADEKD